MKLKTASSVVVKAMTLFWLKLVVQLVISNHCHSLKRFVKWQLKLAVNAHYICITLVPYLAAAGEVKTKPTQHSVKELLSIGIQPDVLICRSDRVIPQMNVQKSHCSVMCQRAVISLKDVDSIYKIPALLKSQGLDEYICNRFRIDAPEANLAEWEQVIYEEANPAGEVTIGMVGKYVELPDAYKSVIEALKHGGLKNRLTVNIKLIDSQDIETRGVELLKV